MDEPLGNIKVIKLSSGDTLVANFKMIKDHSPPYVILENPILFDTIAREDGSATLLAQKWLQTDEKVFTIPFYHIVTAADPNNTILEYYSESLQEIEESEAYEEDEFDHLTNASFDVTYH